MTDVLVSLRLPSSLLGELRKVSAHEHYLDISEAIRSILRERWERAEDPHSFELRRLREEISGQFKSQVVRESEKRLADELKKIKERMRDEL